MQDLVVPLHTVDNTDLGIVGYWCTNIALPPFTGLVNRLAEAITPVALNNAVWQTSSWFDIHHRTDVSIRIAGDLQAQSTFRVRVESQRLDRLNDPLRTLWSPTMMTTARSAIAPNFLPEITISGTDLTGFVNVAGRQDVCLQTGGLHGTGRARVIIQWQQAAIAGDWVIVAVDATPWTY